MHTDKKEEEPHIEWLHVASQIMTETTLKSSPKTGITDVTKECHNSMSWLHFSANWKAYENNPEDAQRMLR